MSLIFDSKEDENFKTTFWNDFSIAEKFGEDAIKDTFNRAFGEWKKDLDYLIELVLVMNWKCWDYWNKYDRTKDEGVLKISELYNDLYELADAWAMKNLNDEDMKEYIRRLD